MGVELLSMGIDYRIGTQFRHSRANVGAYPLQKINIAVGSEVIAKRRAKELESDNAPTPTKISYLFLW